MKWLIIVAICLHLYAKFFWDATVDMSIREKFVSTLSVEQQARYDDWTREYSRAYDNYVTPLAIVGFIWGFLYRKELTGNWKTILSWWLFWLGNEVCKEFSNLTGFMDWFFLSPTQKYLSETIVFFVSTGYLLWQLRFKKSVPNKYF